MADDEPEPRTGGTRRRGLEEDVKRAIGAARKAGLTGYRIEIGPDGTIAITVGAGAPEAPPER